MKIKFEKENPRLSIQFFEIKKKLNSNFVVRKISTNGGQSHG